MTEVTKDNCVTKFNTAVTELLTNIHRITRNPEEKALIERQMDLIRTIKGIDGPQILIKHAADSIVKYHAQILSGVDKFEKFCIEFKIPDEEKSQIPKDYQFVEPLMESLKKQAKVLSAGEKLMMYHLVVTLLECSATYIMHFTQSSK